MSEQTQEPVVTNPPIAEGVQHGPYPDDGTPYSQLDGVQSAIHKAHQEGAISTEGMLALAPGVRKLADDGNRDRWNALSPEEQAAETAEREAEEARSVEEADREFQAAQKEKHLQRVYGDQEETEDPLAGDVDRRVPPEETSDHIGYPDAHSANVARQHGDFTG